MISVSEANEMRKDLHRQQQKKDETTVDNLLEKMKGGKQQKSTVVPIGRCGLCNGRVVRNGSQPPYCEQCSATYHPEDLLPVLPMRPAPKIPTLEPYHPPTNIPWEIPQNPWTPYNPWDRSWPYTPYQPTIFCSF
jgi:hypothetical protein